MLLIIVLIVLAIGIAGLMIYENDWIKYEWINNVILSIGVVATVIAGVGLIFSCIAFGVNYLGVNGDIEKYNKRYESLVFQVENNIYEDDITEGATRELVKDVEKWNCDLADRKVNQYDPWIGIFIPDIYDQFEFISLDKLAEPHWWEENAK